MKKLNFYTKHRYLRIVLIHTMVILSMIVSSVAAGPALNTNTTISYEVDNMNRYSKVDGQPVAYDGRGNIIDDGNATYNYDLLNRQTVATVAGEATQYLYDALGRRIGKIQNGVTTRYIYDLSQQVLEEQRGGALHARLTYGASIDDPVTLEQSGQTYHFHQDALGNVTELTNNGGAVVERYKYNVYGKASIEDGNGQVLASSAVGNELLFNGRRYNPETSTYHYRARVYNPEWGQFLQRDSIDPGLLGSGVQGHNRYSYVTNNPATFIDPSGHSRRKPNGAGLRNVNRRELNPKQQEAVRRMQQRVNRQNAKKNSGKVRPVTAGAIGPDGNLNIRRGNRPEALPSNSLTQEAINRTPQIEPWKLGACAEQHLWAACEGKYTREQMKDILKNTAAVESKTGIPVQPCRNCRAVREALEELLNSKGLRRALKAAPIVGAGVTLATDPANAAQNGGWPRLTPGSLFDAGLGEIPIIGDIFGAEPVSDGTLPPWYEEPNPRNPKDGC